MKARQGTADVIEQTIDLHLLYCAYLPTYRYSGPKSTGLHRFSVSHQERLTAPRHSVENNSYLHWFFWGLHSWDTSYRYYH